MRLTILAAVIVSAAVVLACSNEDHPLAPPVKTPSPPPPVTPVASPQADGTYDVTGIVTDEQGRPVADAEVSWGHYERLSDRITALRRPAVRTDGAGHYAISFRADPLPPPSGFLARAEINADGYDRYYRSFNNGAIPLHQIENFRLLAIKRIVAGDTIVLTVSSADGECTGWLIGPCGGRVRVAAPVAGDLTIEAVPVDKGAVKPQIEACCFGGDQEYGNPITLHVEAGSETWVELGQQTWGGSVAPTVIVRTSLTPE